MSAVAPSPSPAPHAPLPRSGGGGEGVLRPLAGLSGPNTPSPTLPRVAGEGAEAGARPVAIWLFAVAAMIFVMIVLGAVTRLTQSGLSMVEWHPIQEFLPPLSHQAWEQAFAAYKTSPEYLKVNEGIDLATFQGIYFWEWLHRLWGKLIGVAFLLPFLVLLARGAITRRMAPRLALIFLAGGLQGFVGWFMVQSGLVDRPSVSHYRLAAHLAVALLLYAAVLWTALGLAAPGAGSPPGRAVSAYRTATRLLLALVSVTIVWGGFVAGLKAGMIDNSFPLMEGRLIPPDLLAGERSLLENPASVQFVHRVLAMTSLVTALVLAVVGWRLDLPQSVRRRAALVAGTVLLQVTLGILTLLSVVDPLLAALHQANAVVLLTALLLLLWQSRPIAPQIVADLTYS